MWSGLWQCEHEQEDLQRPDECGVVEKITTDRLRHALLSFPTETGLGQDAIHPKAVARVPDELFDGLVELIEASVQCGKWPKALSMNIIVMLPKPDGGIRPIGLLPAPPQK